MPPPMATSNALREAPASISHRQMSSTVAISFPPSVASSARRPRKTAAGSAAATASATQATFRSWNRKTSRSAARSPDRPPGLPSPTIRLTALPSIWSSICCMLLLAAVSATKTNISIFPWKEKILQFPEIPVNLQSVSHRNPSCPDGGIGRRAGLKIQCPLKTCGFDARSGHGKDLVSC